MSIKLLNDDVLLLIKSKLIERINTKVFATHDELVDNAIWYFPTYIAKDTQLFLDIVKEIITELLNEGSIKSIEYGYGGSNNDYVMYYNSDITLRTFK